MGNNIAQRPNAIRDFKWQELKIRVDAYRFYIKLGLEVNAFFYAVTGVVLGFYLRGPDGQSNTYLKFFLLLPIIMGTVLGSIYFYAAKLQKEGSKIVEDIKKELATEHGVETEDIPDVHLLNLLLPIIGGSFFIIGVLLFLVPRLKEGDSPQGYRLFAGIVALVLVGGIGSALILIRRYDINLHQDKAKELEQSALEVKEMQNTNETQTDETQIKTVFDRLGKALEKEKKALKEKHKKSRPKLGKFGKVLYAALIISLFVGVAWYSTWISRPSWGLAFVLVDIVLLSVLIAYRLFLPDWRTLIVPIRRRIKEIGERAIGSRAEGGELAKDTDETTLNQVELLLKHELDEFKARMDFAIDLLKSVNPALIAVAVILKLFDVSLERSFVTVILIMAGALANLLVFTTWLGLRPEVIRCIQCLAIVAHAKEIKKIEAEEGEAKPSE